MQEPAFLMAVQGIVGGIEVENNLLRRLPVGIEEELDEQPTPEAPRAASYTTSQDTSRSQAANSLRTSTNERHPSPIVIAFLQSSNPRLQLDHIPSKPRKRNSSLTAGTFGLN